MPWTPSIPEPTHAPADDVLNMQQNNDQIQTSFSVDHNPLASVTNDGFHKQVHISSAIAQGAQTDPASVIFSQAGVASPFVNLWYKNQNAAFFLNAIKAWAFCPAVGGITASQSFNVTSVTRNSAGQYTVIMPANTVASVNYSVLITTSNCNSGTTSDSCFGTLATDIFIPTATQFVIRTFRQGLTVADPVSFSFVVIQI